MSQCLLSCAVCKLTLLSTDPVQSNLASSWRHFYLVGAFVEALIASPVPLKGQDKCSAFPLPLLSLFMCQRSSELWRAALLSCLALTLARAAQYILHTVFKNSSMRALGAVAVWNIASFGSQLGSLKKDASVAPRRIADNLLWSACKCFHVAHTDVAHGIFVTVYERKFVNESNMI